MSQDMSRYLGLFVSEATEHLEQLGQALVALEKLPASQLPAAVDGLFRHAHSLKGMAASMGFEPITQLAHRAEDLLDVLRSRPGPVEREAVDLLLQAADALSAQVRHAQAGEPLPRAEPLASRLGEAKGALARGMPLPAAVAAAPAAPSPVPAAPGPAAPPRFAVKVALAPGCRVPGVRAFVLYRKLSQAGNVFALSPPLDDLKAGRIPGNTVSLELETSLTEAQLAALLLSIPDLEPASVRRVEGLEPPAEPAEPAPRLVGAQEPARTVRVRTELLDDLLDLAGELLIATAQVRELGRGLPEEHRAPLEEGVDGLHALVKGLHDRVMGARMTPIQVITDRLPRVARDVARRKGMEVELQLSGTDTELDRVILDELADPLLHLLRNCIDHGLESPAAREAAGKPAAGRVRLEVRRERDRVVVEMSDDGRGMDAARLRAAAVERGLLTAAQAEALPDREAWMLACAPGLSTAAAVSDISGRGVGMDAVKRSVESVGGTLEIVSEPGRGTRFTLRLPLTVAVVNLLLAEVGDEVVGLPLSQVWEALDAAHLPVSEQRGQRYLPRGDALVPLYPLAALLGLPPRAQQGQQSGALLLAEAGPGGVALQVDRLLGHQEVVLKALSRPLDAVAGLSGVTLLGSGRPVFILDVPRLLAA